MNPEEINLITVDKMFEYAKHVRFIDKLNDEELKNFAILQNVSLSARSCRNAI